VQSDAAQVQSDPAQVVRARPGHLRGADRGRMCRLPSAL